MFDRLYKEQVFKAKRVSSYDQTGGNADSISIAPWETRVIADIEGPGLTYATENSPSSTFPLLTDVST